MMKAAKRMCVCTRTAITTFLPIIGTSRLPIGTARSPLARREVHYPADGQKHVEDDDYDHQDTNDRGEGPADGVVVLRASIEPRDGEEEPDEDRRHHDRPEGYQRVSGEEHEHLLVEEEEPLRPRYVGDRRRVRRLGERRRGGVGEYDAGDEDKGAYVAILEHLPREEPHCLVRTLEDVLFCNYLFFNRFGLASRRSVHLLHLFSVSCPVPQSYQWYVSLLGKSCYSPSLTVPFVAVPVRAVAAADVGLPFVLVHLVAGVLFEALSFVQLRQPVCVLELAAEHPVTPEQIEVRANKRGYQGREQPDVDSEKARERCWPHSITPQEEVDHVPSHERRVRAYLHPDHGSPEAVLVPPEEVPRKGQPDHEQEQDHADHPVELPRCLVPTREEHLAHVQPDKRHQKVRRPIVDAADDLPEVRVVHDVADRVPRVVCSRRVVEQKQDARQKLQRYREEHRAAQSVEPGAAFGHGLI